MTLMTYLKTMLAVTLVAAIGIAIALVSQPPATPPQRTLSTTATTTALTPNAAETLVNQQRAEHGLEPLSTSKKLRASACAKLNDILKHDYWAHISPAGVTPWHWFKQVGYDYKHAGENLAYGFTSAKRAVSGWMDSPKHRANILNPDFDQQGICRESGRFMGEVETFSVQHLGARQGR